MAISTILHLICLMFTSFSFLFFRLFLFIFDISGTLIRSGLQVGTPQHYYTASLVLQPLKQYGLITFFFTLSSRISCSVLCSPKAVLRNSNNFWLFASTLN